MPFLAPLIGGIAAGIGSLGAVGSALLGIGASVGLSYLSKALGGKSSKTATSSGLEGSLQIAGDVPRGAVFGRAITEGHQVYGQTGGSFASTPNLALDRVYAIGEGPHDALESVWVDGKLCTLSLVSASTHVDHYTVNEYNYPTTGVPCMHLWFFRGYTDQPALSELVTNANPSDRWTSDYRGSGVCYVATRCLYFKEVFSSFPAFSFGIRGRRLYDWRSDTTAGGDGPQRWSDQTSWVYSANPIVQLYNFQRGLRAATQLLYGANVQTADLVLDAYTAAANACDESVMDSAGSSADRYSCGTIISDAEEHGAVIQRFLDSCAGAMYERAGAFAPLAGVAQATTYPTITDGDLVSGFPIRFIAKRGRAELVNGVFGTYTDLSQNGASVSYPSRVDLDAVTLDTEQRYSESDYPQVFDPVQAQRLAELELLLARLQATATITLGMSAVVLEPGDWVRWTSARFGDRRWMIERIQEGQGTYTLDLREINATAFGEIDDVPLNGGLPGVGDTDLTTVPMFSVTSRTLVGDNGLKTPAIQAGWQAILDNRVDALLFEYRVVGQTDVLTARSDDPLSGAWVWSAGLQSETDYEVRATITSTPPRSTTWTDWLPVTTTEQIVPVGMQNFEAGLRDKIANELGAADAEYRAGIENLNLIVAELAAHQAVVRLEDVRRVTATFGNQKAEYLLQIGAVADDVSATVSRVETLESTAGSLTTSVATINSTLTTMATENAALATSVTALQVNYTGLSTSVSSLSTSLSTLATETSAIATEVTDLSAAVDDLSASVNVTWAAGVTPAGATAAWDLQLVAGSVVVGMSAIALSGGGGQIRFQADKFLFAKADGTTFALLQSAGGNFYLDGNIFADGSILAQHLSVSTLSAITGNMGTLTVGRMLSTNGKVDFNLTDTYLLFKD
ncbi:phage tail protein [Xanthobacter sp. DSM 24535]|uniref:phage tail protein n=1 Tax=Roseixanthobacter psychrophilus TaxID=3119917 RepID=UPI003728790F